MLSVTVTQAIKQLMKSFSSSNEELSYFYK